MLCFHNQSNCGHRFIKYLWYPTNAMILMDQLCTKVFIQVPSLKDNTSVFIPCDFCREKKVHKIFVLNIISRVMISLLLLHTLTSLIFVKLLHTLLHTLAHLIFVKIMKLCFNGNQRSVYWVCATGVTRFNLNELLTPFWNFFLFFYDNIFIPPINHTHTHRTKRKSLWAI